MHIPSPIPDADLSDPYPWATAEREDCDWCGKTSCLCATDPEGDFERILDDDTDDGFFELCDEHGVPW